MGVKAGCGNCLSFPLKLFYAFSKTLNELVLVSYVHFLLLYTIRDFDFKKKNKALRDKL